MKDEDNFDICQHCFNYYQLPVCDCQSIPISKIEFDKAVKQIGETYESSNIKSRV